MNVGHLHSVRWGYAGSAGNGAEITFVHYPRYRWFDDTDPLIGLGGFAQFEAVPNSEELTLRFGPQVNFAFVGVEAGVEILSGDVVRPSGSGAYFGTFCSIGL